MYRGTGEDYRVDLSAPGNIYLNNLGRGEYLVYLHEDAYGTNGKYESNVVGQAFFVCYNGNSLKCSVSNIQDTSGNLTKTYLRSQKPWDTAVQISSGNFGKLDDSSNRFFYSNNGKDCMVFDSNGNPNWSVGIDEAGNGNVWFHNLKPNTSYNVRMIPVVGQGANYNESEIEYAFDYNNVKTLNFKTAKQEYYGKITNLKTATSYNKRVDCRLKWKQNVSYYDYYELQYQNLATGKTGTNRIDVSSWNNRYVDIRGFEHTSFYKARLRGVALDESGTHYSKWSNYTYFNPSQLPADVKLKVYKRSAKVSWKKVAGATNYTIYFYKQGDEKWKKLVTTKKTSFTIKKYSGKKLSRHTHYLMKIVANKKVGSKIYRTQSSFFFKVYTK